MAITPSGAGTFTALHFVVLALLILATVALIAVGVRRSRLRRRADERVDAEAEQVGIPDASDLPASAERPTAPVEYVRADGVPADPITPDRRDEAVVPDPLADEPVAAAAPMDASPATLADPTPLPPAPDPTPADGPVTQLKGLGPKVATRLGELGLTNVGQIAALDADRAAAIDRQLGPFAGRLHRDRWVEQARFLAAGDKAGFEAVFGRL